MKPELMHEWEIVRDLPEGRGQIITTKLRLVALELPGDGERLLTLEQADGENAMGDTTWQKQTMVREVDASDCCEEARAAVLVELYRERRRAKVLADALEKIAVVGDSDRACLDKIVRELRDPKVYG